MIVDIDISREIIGRMKKRLDLDKLRRLCGVDIVIAGGALLDKTPNDFDVYAASDRNKLQLEDLCTALLREGWDRVARTPNALTMRDTDDRVFQFCTYVKETPEALIRSFDFAHCQVGIAIREGMAVGYADDNLVEVICTPDFVKSMCLQKTYFTGSQYPLSSLIRAVKYAERGWYGKGRAYCRDMISIFTAVVERGFKDYNDFKDQLDAVDLAYSEDNAFKLWKAIEKRFKPA